jgi:hypothetical protein
MKSKMNVESTQSVHPRNERVRIEIQTFLLALDSYPRRFAKEPKISFQEHLGSLVAAREDDLRRRN